MNNIITRELIEKACTYDSYKELVSKLVREHKTTGPNQSDRLADFTKLNFERTKRIEKTTRLEKDLKQEMKKLNRPTIFLVIAEAWCGDVAQNLPVIHKIAKENKNVEFRIILRDENPDVMNEFLTNGSKSIPVCIFLDKETLHVLGKWGPRPEPAQKMMTDNKSHPKFTHDEIIKKIQLWYTEDKGRTIQREFLQIVHELNTHEVTV
jgi:thioredoxin-like negative regulator of GroEL